MKIVWPLICFRKLFTTNEIKEHTEKDFKSEEKKAIIPSFEKENEANNNINTTTPELCNNEAQPIIGLTEGAIALVPVILAQFSIQIILNYLITLPEPVLDIKKIHKTVVLTKCFLLQDTNVLWIKEFIQNNIEYSPIQHSNSNNLTGLVRHCTINVPFSCSTPVEFNSSVPTALIYNTTSQFQFSKGLSDDISEFNQITTQYYNKRPYCELVNSRMVEFDEFVNNNFKGTLDYAFGIKLFKKIEEKVMAFMTVELIQKQEITIPPTME